MAYATPAQLQYIQAVWQSSFVRLNQGQPGISGLLNHSQAWQQVQEFLYPRPLETYTFPFTHDITSIQPAFKMLEASGQLTTLCNRFLDDVQGQQHLIANAVNDFFTDDSLEADAVLPITIANMVVTLTMWYDAWRPPLEFGTVLNVAFAAKFRSFVYAALPPAFVPGFKRLIRFTLDPASATWSAADPTDPLDPGVVLPQGLVDNTIWDHFEVLGLVERHEALVHNVMHEYIEQHVHAAYAGSEQWAEQTLPKLYSWTKANLVPWMFHPFARGAQNYPQAQGMVANTASTMVHRGEQILAELRIKELWDIILDYPDSVGAIKDLCYSCHQSDLRGPLVKALKAEHRKRLLHPGVHTEQILEVYVATIRVLRLIDPPGVLLHQVAEPIRRYLRARPDTIRVIVAALVGDTRELGDRESILHQLLADENGTPQPLQTVKAEDYDDPHWVPEPKDAPSDFRSHRPLDIVSTLVSIYDSRDLFIKEVQSLISTRLLELKDGNFDNELRQVEILKIRFGEAALQVCEVMLRDMSESKRINQHIHAREPMLLSTTVISEHFWPTLEPTQFTLPPALKKIQDAYSKEYHIFKPDKRLRWLPMLGMVQIEFEMKDRIVETEITVLAAAFVELFLEKPRWTITELMQRVNMKEQHKHIALRVVSRELMDNAKVLDEVDDEPETYEVMEFERSKKDRRAKATPAAMEESEEDNQAEAQQMRVFWNFIQGMLRNLGSLPLDRIHNMLKLAPNYDRTPDQLAGFMEAARREGLVAVSDGKWRLQANPS